MSIDPLTRDILLRRVTAYVEHGQNYAAAARSLGIARSTLQESIEKAVAAGIRPTGLRDPDDNIPMSEDQRKFHADWSAEDCIAELVRIASIDTTKVISRNYFRNNSEISESTWNRYFGTFEEFKRQADITLSRHAHRMERDIAKHASVSRMKDMNDQKLGWEGTFLRPSSKRWQSVLVCCDIHDIHCDPFYRRTLVDTLFRVQPEKFVINGDLFDLPEFSKHFQDPRSFDLVKRVNWVHSFLYECREAAPDAEIIFIAGNHEERLLRHLSESTPAMLTVLADLHGMTVASLLGLNKFEVNFISRVDLTAWTERDFNQQLRKNYVTLYDNALLFGHFPQMRSMGIPGSSGHHHRLATWSWYHPMTGPSIWMQIGCGHQREASYCAGEKWSNSFLHILVDTHTKRSQFDHIDVTGVGAMIGGRFYERTANEPILDLIR